MQDKAQAFHAMQPEDVLDSMEVTPGQGLTREQSTERKQRFGANAIRTSKQRGALSIWVAQFRSVVVGILAAAAALAFGFGKLAEGIAILAVILINCLIGFLSEWRAARSMEALQKMGKRRVRVRRQGQEHEIEATDLVPGDICLHESGDMISADLRLIEANKLQVDESTLTGESIAVTKQTEPVPEDAVLPDRTSMLYRGTTITSGSAAGVVVAIGMDTELGRVADMAQGADRDESTPLERRLNQLGQRLAWVALGAAAVVAGAGILSGKSWVLMIETAIALGVAAVPEGLPFVATIALARGMWLMAQKQALINRLPAVETLGTTDIIISDKTGTLTENRMEAVTLVTPSQAYDLKKEQTSTPGDDAVFARCLEIGALCNNASISDRDGDGQAEETQGDPTEVALLVVAARFGLDRQELLQQKPEVHEEAFNAERMMMATVHKANGHFSYAIKGAPQAVIEACDAVAGNNHTKTMTPEQQETWKQQAQDLAGQGLRVLALADKEADSGEAAPYEGLRFLGLIGLLDPPRKQIRTSIQACHQAGIRVIMVTGDQPETAQAIATDIGLYADNQQTVLHGAELGDMEDISEENKQHILQAPVFARVSPEQKLRILELFQAEGHTVAMTGDGVNDAPALEKASIGVAMGKRGTDAAKESADMVLKNDAFSSILSAVEQGRVIFGNIRKSVIFMLCTNGAEVAAVGIASVLEWPLPIRPLQILYLNVITDVFPALALSVGKGDPERAMQRPPRDAGTSVLGRREWLAISLWSSIMCACVLGALLAALHILGFPATQAVTVSFLTLACAKLWFVFNLRDAGTSIVQNDVARNPWVWTALAACIILLIAAVYIAPLSALLETVHPGWKGWSTILAISLIPMLAGQTRLYIKGRSR